jgi:hypothetical protein
MPRGQNQIIGREQPNVALKVTLRSQSERNLEVVSAFKNSFPENNGTKPSRKKILPQSVSITLW